MIKVGITGQAGFIGTHLYNTLGLYPDIFERIQFHDSYFQEEAKLQGFVSSCDAIVHLAAMNRHGDPHMIYNTNIGLVKQLISACQQTQSKPHILFSSSTQEERDNLYGRSKKEGRQMLEQWAKENNAQFTGFVIPNVFGPFGHPYYNSVVATFCHQLTHNEQPKIEVDGEIKLIYVGELVEIFIEKIKSTQITEIKQIGTDKVIDNQSDQCIPCAGTQMTQIEQMATDKISENLSEHCIPCAGTQMIQIEQMATDKISENLSGQCIPCAGTQMTQIEQMTTDTVIDNQSGQCIPCAGTQMTQIEQMATDKVIENLSDQCIPCAGTLMTQIEQKDTDRFSENLSNQCYQCSINHTAVIKVSALLKKLESFKKNYLEQGILPCLDDPFDRNLFNTFLTYIDHNNFFPFHLKLNTDDRGSFVETVRLHSGGQVSFSTTKRGITRGNHFHTRKAERFAVIKGKARIELRRIGTDKVLTFDLDGNKPSFVDMPVWHTHNITNTGEDDLYTIFWINEHFDAKDPDTFFEKV